MSRVLEVVGAAEESALLGELRDLARRAKASWGYDGDFMDRFAATMLPDRLTGPERRTWIAREDGTVVGFAIADELDHRLWLEDLWVEPAHQRHGVGRLLMDAVTGWARERGLASVDCESDPFAEPFYLALGARRVATRPSTLAPDRSLPLMSLSLEGGSRPA